MKELDNTLETKKKESVLKTLTAADYQKAFKEMKQTKEVAKECECGVDKIRSMHRQHNLGMKFHEGAPIYFTPEDIEKVKELLEAEKKPLPEIKTENNIRELDVDLFYLVKKHEK